MRTGERPPSWLRGQRPVLKPESRRIESAYIACAVALGVGALLCAYVAMGGKL